jgi:hypothetical protein
MAPSLLFIPDISGFTKFVNTTEVAHGRHVKLVGVRPQDAFRNFVAGLGAGR